MSQSPQPDTGAGPPLGARHVDEVCDRFEDAWLAGQRPRVEAFLHDVAEPKRSALRHELLLVLVHYLQIDQRRRWQQGERASVREYLHETPELREEPEIVFGLICHEVLLRQEQNDTSPQLEDYLDLLPCHEAQLRRFFTDRRVLPLTTLDVPGGRASLRPAQLPYPAAPPQETARHGCGVETRLAQVGRYRLLHELGAGAMGAVYLAEDPQLGRRVAIKVPAFRGTSGGQPRDCQRFQREARAAAAVRHAHVCAIHDVGEQDGTPFVVMDYIDGCSLADRLRDDGRFDDCRAAVALAVQVAEGLVAVHEAGVIHRDLKPGNILLDKAGDAYLSDFGLARWQNNAERLTTDGDVVGTPAYMAPEQISEVQFGPVTPRTDVYSLGVVLYQMLTGRLPFLERDTMRLLYQIMNDRPPPPRELCADLDPALEAIVQQAMAREPKDRYADARQFLAALRGWLNGTGVVDGPSSGRRRRWPLRAAGLLLGVLLLGGVLYGAVWGIRHFLAPTDAGRPGNAEPLAGWIDVRVWKKDKLLGPGQWLGPHVMPFNQGDEVRVEAELNRPAYFYVVWLDTTGKPLPLYSWDPHWNWPAEERPAARLSLPATPGNRWPISPGTAGMETLLLLARETPWPRDVDLRTLLDGLPPPAMQDPSSVVWFRNWAVVRDEDDRAPNLFEERAGDPLLVTQEKLRERLQPYGVFSRAVSFANAGR
jgi:hypothetical protein